MPRHRKECIPKHRAQSPGYRSGRRVPMDAAIDAAKTALESAREPFQGTSEDVVEAVQASAAEQFSAATPAAPASPAAPATPAAEATPPSPAGSSSHAASSDHAASHDADSTDAR